MKPSEMIRKGRALVSGQTAGIFYNAETDCACAIGCLWLGHGITKEDIINPEVNLPDIEDVAPGFWEAYVKEYGDTPYIDNDVTDLSIEAIADRCEAIGY